MNLWPSSMSLRTLQCMHSPLSPRDNHLIQRKSLVTTCGPNFLRPLTLRKRLPSATSFPLEWRERFEQVYFSWWHLTVMEAATMYHVCSFHNRLQTQLIPFRFKNTWSEKKGLRWEFSHTAHSFGERAKKANSLIISSGDKKYPCRYVTATNHQFHREPITVLSTRPISIQAFLKPFGAFDALKGLIVPSSAPL